MDLVARWRPYTEAQRDAGAAPGCLLYQGVREGLARLALSKDPKLLPKLLDSDDPALRIAAYATGWLSPAQLKEAYGKDGDLAFYGALDHNLWVWRTASTREVLHEIARSELENGVGAAPWCALDSYNRVCDDMTKKHPDWFKDDEDLQEEVEISDAPATKGDLAELAQCLGRVEAAQYDQLWIESLKSLNRRIGWI